MCTLAAAAFSYIWLKYVLKDARGVIHFMLMASVAMQVATAVLSMLAGQVWLFVMSLVFCMVTLCYYRLVRNRIPFASTNLAVATKAIGNASGPVLVSFLVIFVQLCWQFVWTLGNGPFQFRFRFRYRLASFDKTRVLLRLLQLTPNQTPLQR